MSWYWHEIGDKESARYAAHPAVWVSYLIAVAGGLVGVFSLIFREPIAGMNGWALLDAFLFLIVGWRIAHLSRFWAVAGLFLMAFEIIVATLERLRQPNVAVPIVSIIFLTTYINAVRGAFAYRRYVKFDSNQLSNPAQTE